MSVALKQTTNDNAELPLASNSISPLLQKRTLGRTGLLVSPVCFGSLRLTPENGIYKETLYQALQQGIHFIDTSGSYGNGASELLIGETLREYLQDHPQHTKDIVLCTKLGLVQGATLQELNRSNKQSKTHNGVYKLSDRLSYSLNPEHMENQITLSLRRLQVNKVNLVLLQSPEHLIKFFKKKEAFFQYLKRAFEHLEVEVAKGRIDHYGISSSAFIQKEISPQFLNVDEVVKLAQSISPRHHFSVVQVPFNLFETDPLFYENQNKRSFFMAASVHNLGVLTYRPLTAHHRNKVHHFITFPGKDEVSVKGRLHKTILDVVEMEKELHAKRSFHPDLNWGHTLRDHLSDISDWWQWNQYLQKEVFPSVNRGIESLPQSLDWNHWKISYINNIHTLFSLITDSLQGIANLRTNQICHYLNQECEVLSGDSKLSNKVTRLYLSLPEITSVVMGLSDPQHVTDLIELGSIPDPKTTYNILRKIKMHF